MMMRESKNLKRWYLLQLLQTKSPINEHMTLFWHNHFTSSLEKVEQPKLLFQQNQLLRKHALGNFESMLRAIARDPAMLVYLDGNENVIGAPNENFARELLELFTLGRGQYTESDIKAAAIAFTGWGVNFNTGQFAYEPAAHDPREVVFLGKRGKFSGDDIISILLEHPRTAENIAEKFWKEFISDERPNPRVVKHWGNVFRNSNYNISVLYKSVLMSDLFWAKHNRGSLTKSPIDLVVGSFRTLPYPKLPDTQLVHILKLLGQDLFDPPTVKGWRGGKSWIDTQTLLVRTSLVNKITRHSKQAINVDKNLPRTTGEEVVRWLLPLPPVLSLPRVPGRIRMVRALMLDPVYQMK